MSDTREMYAGLLAGNPMLTQAAQAAANWVQRQRAQSVAMGLLDPQTGWPTAAGARQAGMAAAMGMGVKDVAGPEDFARLGLNPNAPGFADRISTRQPSLTPDVANTSDYLVGRDAADRTGGPYQGRVADVISRHVGMPEGSTVDDFVEHLKGNIRAVWDAVPDTWKGQAMGWYDGANSIAQSMAQRFGTSVRAQAANLAAQSPQRQWDHNVELGLRVGDIVANHADDAWSPQMEQAFRDPTQGTGLGFGESGQPRWDELYGAIQGKTLNQISNPQEAALWVRLHDLANAPDQNVRIVNPDGTFGDLLRNDPDPKTPDVQGDPATLQWGTLGSVGNAISVLRDDSLGNISEHMGDAHKVRNFYNNIISPNAGHDVTIDTHAGSAALLRPLGSSNPEIAYTLGSPVKKDPWRLGDDPWPTTMNNAPEGVKGLYPYYAQAYRDVANDLGVLPRQVQSVTWEGIRGLYNDVDRRNDDLMTANANTWQGVSDGTTTAPAARADILSRGIRDPNWFQPPAGATAAAAPAAGAATPAAAVPTGQ